MSLNTQVIVGYSAYLDYTTYNQRIFDNFVEYIETSDNTVCLVIDSMNGNYVYLMYVLGSIEEMYQDSLIKIKQLKETNRNEMKRIFKELTGTTLEDNQIELIVLNHIT